MCTNEKAKQTVLQHQAVPIWHVVKSFEVVIILVLNLKTHTHADFLEICSSSLQWLIILMHSSKGEQMNFKFLFILSILSYWGKVDSNSNTITGLRNFHN